MVTHALSARLPVFLGTKVPERNLQNPSTCIHYYNLYSFTIHAAARRHIHACSI